jgi:hypothetical protein
MLLSGTTTLFGGDFDMQVQMTEAAKKAMLEFHQFPSWNPWVSGGVPLFADPQFGLVTPQTIFSLVFDSAFAWKLTIFLYLIVGFISMRKLLLFVLDDRSAPVIATLLSYIWIFGSFFTLRANGGHFTFLVLSLLPLAIYLLLNITKSNKYSIYLTLLIAYCVNAALHYSTILLILTLVFIATCHILLTIYKELRNPPKKDTHLKNILLSAKPFALLVVCVVIAFTLTSVRIYQTLEYLHDNSVERSSVYENFIGIPEGIKSIFLPYGSFVSSPALTYGHFEASNYIGTVTGLLFILLLIAVLIRHHRVKVEARGRAKDVSILIIFIFITLASFTIGLGGEVYALIRELPVMSSMRVSTRYFFITSSAIIVLLGLLANYAVKQKVIGKHTNIAVYVCLSLACVHVLTSTYKLQYTAWVNNKYLTSNSLNTSTKKPPFSEVLWHVDTASHYYALTESTMQNKAQVIADNALVDTRSLPTQRCDEDQSGCKFILSNNARVTSWSPTFITLIRTGPGAIKINMNQASHWKVNDTYLFANQKVVNSDSTFAIPDSSATQFDLTYAPLPRILK